VSSAPCVIFDCDGVLVDSEVLAVEVTRSALAGLGWDLSIDEVVARFVGRSHDQVYRDIAEHLGRPLPPGWEAQNTQRLRDVFRDRLQPVEGIVEALALIDAPMCVASSGSVEKMRLTLGLTGLWDAFGGNVFSATEVANGKPAPDLFLHAAEAMGWQPGDCVVVEDSLFGVQAGLSAGMRVIGYGGGVTPASRLALPGVTVIDDMRDLPAMLAR
jgi:HAD superfamily hydrolase (TIGR01509 family)